jgi:hypothetical protein
MLVCSTSQLRLVLAGVVLLGTALACGSAGNGAMNESADGGSNPPLEDGGRGVVDASVLPDGAQSQGPVTESKQAKDILESLRARFQFPAPPAHRGPVQPILKGRRPLLVKGEASTFVTQAGAIKPEFQPTAGAIRRGRTEFPDAADGFARLTDEQTGTWIDARLVLPKASRAEVASGYVVRPDAMGEGNHVLQRPFDRGFEDYVVFERAPAKERVEYDLRHGDQDVYFRLVEDQVLEVLDKTGTPRLRVSPPELLSENGAVTRARFSLRGCQFDTNPAAPWHRAPVAPGASPCVLTVSWSGVRYPAVLDPGFTTTGNMVVPRIEHSAVLLASGKVLVVGGTTDWSFDYTTTELFDPETGTWAATGSTNDPRHYHTATFLEDGRVLVTGGYLSGDAQELKTVELYQPGTGTWTRTADMHRARSSHVAARLYDGRVLVAVGWVSDVAQPNDTAEVFEPEAGTWTSVGAPSVSRMYATADRLQDGRVLIVGGDTGTSSTIATDLATVFDPQTGTFATTGSLASGARGYHVSTLLPSGKVLISGGYRPGVWLATNELYDPVGGTFQSAASMSVARIFAPSSFLAPNSFLTVGGGNGVAGHKSAEIYRAASNDWHDAGALSWFTTNAAAAKLRDGRVLVSGGYTDDDVVSSNAAIFEAEPDPTAGGTCGDGVRAAATEECDNGSSNGVRATCSAQCRVQDLRAIDDPLPTTNRSRTLGAGRHPITGYDTGAFGTAFVEVNDGVPSVRVTGVQLNGIPSDRAVTVGEGPSILLGSDPVIAGVGGAVSVVAYTDRNADGDLLGVALRRVHPFGEWVGPVVRPNTTTTFSQFDPDILWTGAELVVAWADDSDLSSGPDIRYRVYDASLTPKPTLDGPASSQGTLSAAPEPEQDVVLSRFGTSWAAAWRSFSAGTETIRVRTGTSNWTVGPFLPGPASQKPALAELDASHLLLVYVEGADLGDSGVPSEGQVRARVLELLSPPAVPTSLAVDVLPASSHSRTEASLAGTGAEVWLAWRQAGAVGDPLGESVFMKRLSWATAVNGSLDTSATPISVPRTSTHQSGDQRRPNVGMVQSLNSYEASSLVCAWEDLAATLGSAELRIDAAVQKVPLPLSRLP